MIDWIEAMPIVEKCFFFVALPTSLIMIIQAILLLFSGGGDSGLDSDTSGLGMDVDSSFGDAGDSFGADFDDVSDAADLTGASGLRFLTSRGIITFLTVFGWSGVCFLELGWPIPLVITVATILSFGAMVAVAFLVRGLMGLQSDGNINYRDALGKYADVYLTIPKKGAGQGKVTLTLGGALSQFDAITEDEESIKTGETVRVTDILHESIFVVEKDRT